MRRPIAGWENYYEVSDMGEVFSLPRTVVRKDGTKQSWQGRKMTTFINSAGYVGVHLSRPGKRMSAKVHRLVAIAFIPNPNNLPEVNHKDGKRDNPSVENLEWVTQSENRLHAARVLGTVRPPRNNKMSFEIAEEIRSRYVPKIFGCRRIAALYKINKKTVMGIVHGHYYPPLPPPPEEA